jgi:hypothetical protein
MNINGVMNHSPIPFPTSITPTRQKEESYPNNKPSPSNTDVVTISSQASQLYQNQMTRTPDSPTEISKSNPSFLNGISNSSRVQQAINAYQKVMKMGNSQKEIRPSSSPPVEIGKPNNIHDSGTITGNVESSPLTSTLSQNAPPASIANVSNVMNGFSTQPSTTNTSSATNFSFVIPLTAPQEEHHWNHSYYGFKDESFRFHSSPLFWHRRHMMFEEMRKQMERSMYQLSVTAMQVELQRSILSLIT